MKLDLNEKVLEFFRTAYERQLVYTQKENNSPFPWTSDEILRDFYFVNLFREQDPTTIYLKDKIDQACSDGLARKDILFNIWLFRGLDNIESWETLVGDFLSISDFVPEEFNRKATERKREKLLISTQSHPALSVQAIIGGHPMIAKLCPVLVEDLEKMRYLEDIYELLTVIPSINALMGYQIAQDCSMGNNCISPKALNNDWCPSTPNALAGMELLYGFKMTPKEAAPHLVNLKNAQYEAYSLLGLPVNVLNMNMSSIERWLGEYVKYNNIKTGNTSYRRYELTVN